MKFSALADGHRVPLWPLLLLAGAYGIFGGFTTSGGFVPWEQRIDYTDPDAQGTFVLGFTAAPHPMFLNQIITYVVGDRAFLRVRVDAQELLSFKLKVVFRRPQQALTVQCNGRDIGTVMGREPHIAHKFFLKVPATDVVVGVNTLTLINRAPESAYVLEELVLRNYRATGKMGFGVILHKGSAFLLKPRPQMTIGWIGWRFLIAYLLLAAAWILGVSATLAVTRFSWAVASLINFVALWIPCLVTLGVCGGSWATSYVILTSNTTLVVGSIAGALLLNSFLASVRLATRSSTWLINQYLAYLQLVMDGRAWWNILRGILTRIIPRQLLKLVTAILLTCGFLIYLASSGVRWWLRHNSVVHNVQVFATLMLVSAIPLKLGWRGGAEQLVNAAFLFVGIAVVTAIVEWSREVRLSAADGLPARRSPPAPSNKVTSRNLKFLEEFDDGVPDVFHGIVYAYAQPYLQGRRSLNVGCWTGGFEAVAAREGHRLVSADLELKALKIVPRVAPGVSVLCAEAQQLPFRSGSFETVTFFTVLEHLPAGREGEVLAELCRVLTPGGTLILTTPQLHWLGNIADVAWWLAGHRHYRPDHVRRLLTAAGFEIERLDLRGRWFSNVTIPLFYVWKYLFRKNLYRLPLVSQRLRAEYTTPGYRDIFLIARKPAQSTVDASPAPSASPRPYATTPF